MLWLFGHSEPFFLTRQSQAAQNRLRPGGAPGRSPFT